LEGVVTIASSTVPSEWLLPEILLIIRAAHPQVRESVKVSDSETAIAAVEAGDVDFALVGELPRATNLCAKRVAEDELVLIVPPQHSFAKLKSIEPVELVNQPLIFRESGSGSRRCVENAISSAKLSISELTIPIEVNSNDAIRAAVERGVGISFLSRRAIKWEIEAGRLVVVEIEGVKIVRSLYLVTDPQRVPNRILSAVLKLIDEFRKGTFQTKHGEKPPAATE
jgi:DNA-binding transcriptional LysR family regulator